MWRMMRNFKFWHLSQQYRNLNQNLIIPRLAMSLCLGNGVGHLFCSTSPSEKPSHFLNRKTFMLFMAPLACSATFSQSFPFLTEELSAWFLFYFRVLRFKPGSKNLKCAWLSLMTLVLISFLFQSHFMVLYAFKWPISIET